MKFWKLICAAVVAVSVVGCSSFTMKPIAEPTNEVSGYTAAQVKTAILNAENAGRGWVLKSVNNNTIKGTILNRGYSAEVSIPYSAKGYTIKYVSSSANLKSENGKIHRVYNRWVINLDNDIRANLMRAK